MTDLVVRPATPPDSSAIAEIYNHYVRTSTATFDTDPKSAEDRAAWLSDRRADHPVLVAESGGKVVAWGALGPWSARSAYRYTVEISTYVASEHLGEGIGAEMSRRLIAEARRLGHHAIVSQIVHENEASLKMTKSLGFERVGTLREVGRKFDRWLDVVLMELVLAAPAEGSSV